MAKKFEHNNDTILVDAVEIIYYNNSKVNVYEFWEIAEQAYIFCGRVCAKTYKSAITKWSR